METFNSKRVFKLCEKPLVKNHIYKCRELILKMCCSLIIFYEGASSGCSEERPQAEVSFTSSHNQLKDDLTGNA